MTEMLCRAQNSPQERTRFYEQLSASVRVCERCGLCKTRENTVFGEGNIASRIMFVGEGPGEDEDRCGHPFVGRAGQLLTKILEPAGFRRSDVYITNIVKCRPPQNRNPGIQEVLSCQRWLEAQIALLAPRIIVTLGNVPMKWFLHCTEGVTRMRGRWYDWNGVKLFPMFHPSYLLRNEIGRAHV